MLIFLLSLVSVAAVASIGALIVRAISIIPTSILARAAEGGRYWRLESRDPPSRVGPKTGRRAPRLHAASCMAVGASI
jgi:hypothetical protein